MESLTRRKAKRIGQTPAEKIDDYYHLLSADVKLTAFVDNLRLRYHNIWNYIVSLSEEDIVVQRHIEYCKKNNIKISTHMAARDLAKAITIFNGYEKQKIRAELISKLKLYMESHADTLKSANLEKRYCHLQDLLNKF